MIPSFRGKKNKDIEHSAETLISSSSLINNMVNTIKPGSKTSITEQITDHENFDNFIEKKIN